jgi:hypothetical protein
LVRQDGLRDTLPSEGLLPEPLFDVIENFTVKRVGIIQDIFECQVCGTEAVTEVLGEDPTGI